MVDWREEAEARKNRRAAFIVDGDDTDLIQDPLNWCNELHDELGVLCRKQRDHGGKHAMYVYSSFVKSYRVEW